MRRRHLIVVALAVLAGLPGCRALERLTKEREPAGAEPVARTKEKDKDRDWLRERQDREPGAPPKDWLAGPATPGRNDRVPPADRAADPASRGFDAKAAQQRTLSGTLEDADGRPLANTYITVENADPIKAGYGAPMGVESDTHGYFEINGLTAGEHYMLAASVRGSKPQAGRLAVQVPNSRVRLRLKEDFMLPPGRDKGDLPPSIPPPAANDAPSSVPPAPKSEDWSPLGPEKKEAPAPRNDLVAPGPQPEWKSTMPPASIPGPTAPGMPSPTMPSVPPPPLLEPSKSESRSSKLSVLGSDGRERALLSGRAEDLVLLDFLTTTCAPCKKAIPALVSFDEKYSRQVEVIGVLCDGENENRRVELAGRYRKENRLPYAVVAESSRTSLQDKFSVEAYPTLVLLDGTGRRLWKGHPKDLAEAERIIRNR